MSQSILVTIGGVDVTALVTKLSYGRGVNQAGQARLRLEDPTGAYIPADDAVVQITIGGTLRWTGEISDKNVDFLGENVGVAVDVTATDWWGRLLKRTIVNRTIPAGTTKALLQSLTAAGTGELARHGITLDAAQTDGPSLPQFDCTLWTAEDLLNQAATQGKIVIAIAPNKSIRAWVPGDLSSGATLAVSDGSINSGTWSTRTYNYRNRQWVVCGGTSQVARSYSGTADGATHAGGKEYFATPYPVPNDINVTWPNAVTVTGYPATPVGWGAASGFPWYWDYEATPGRMVHLDSDPYMGHLAAGTGVSFDYTQQCPFTVTEDDLTEQGLHGVWEAVDTRDDLLTVTDGQAWAQALIRQSIGRPKIPTLETLTDGILPGYTVVVSVPQTSLSSTCFAQRIDVDVIKDLDQCDLVTTLVMASGDERVATPADLWRRIITGDTTFGGVGGSLGGGVSVPVSGMPPVTSPLVIQCTGGFTLGELAAHARIRYLSGVFSLLTESDAYASLMGRDATFSWQLAVGTTNVDGNQIYAVATTSSWTAVRGDSASGWGLVGYNTGSTYYGLIGGPAFAADFKGPVVPHDHWAYDWGLETQRIKTLYAGELNVWSLAAKSVTATIGGEIWTAPTTVLLADIDAVTTTIATKHALAAGDFLMLKSIANFEFMRVVSGGGSGESYSYTVERNKDGTGANAWPKGTAVVNTGTTGSGLIAQYADAPVLVDGKGPTILGLVRTGTSWSNLAPRWAAGNLYGLYDYGPSTVYGFAAGNASGTWIAIDAVNGLRIMYGSTPKVSVDASGNAAFTGAVTATSGTFSGTVNAGAGYFGSSSSVVAIDASGLDVGTSGRIKGGASAYGTGTGFWLGYDGAYKFRIGNPSGQRLFWDGSDLGLYGAHYSLTTSGGLAFGDASGESDYSNEVSWASGGVIGGNSARTWMHGPGGTWYTNVYTDRVDIGYTTNILFRVQDTDVSVWRNFLPGTSLWMGHPDYRWNDGWFNDLHVLHGVTDSTPWPAGPALPEILQISGKGGEIDHATLPASVYRKVPYKKARPQTAEQIAAREPKVFDDAEVEGRNLSAMVSLLTKAIQEQQAQIDALKK